MEIISGSLLTCEAKFECGGCGKPFKVEMEVSGACPPGWSLFDLALDSIRGGFEGGSLQGGYILCRTCTQTVDDSVKEDRNATESEVRKIFSEDEF